MPEHDVHELVCPVISQIVAKMLRCPEVGGFRIIQGGNDVPCDSTIQQEIDGRKHPGDVERFVIGSRIGNADSEMPGR